MDAKKTKSSTKEAAAPNAANGPIKVFRIEDCSVSVFARERQLQGEVRTFYSTSFSRSYKNPTGATQYTKNFDVEDLGKIVALCQQASDYIHGLQVRK